MFFALFALTVAAPVWAIRLPFHSWSTHSTVSLSDGSRYVAYHPPPVFEVYDTGLTARLTARGSSHKEAGLAFLRDRLGAETVQFKSSLEGDVTTHIYVTQQIHGVPVHNAVANVALNKAGKITSFSSSFVPSPRSVAPSTPTLTAEDAVRRVEEALNGAVVADHPVDLEYYAQESGDLLLVHGVPLDLTSGQRVLALMNAETGDVVTVINQTLDLTYRAVPLAKNVPVDNFELIVDPEDPLASPNGWTTVNGIDTHSTNGTNVIGHAYLFASKPVNETSPGAYDYPYDFTIDPKTRSDVNAATVNGFYVVNMMHDITYHYGFTENAFNFQGNDPIRLFVTSTAYGTNNANFFPSRDGVSPQLHVLVWTYTTPGHDGALENDIVIHEYTHGLSTRLTGGGVGTCLNAAEAGGLGEGWSDAVADWVSQTSLPIKDYVIGSWAKNITGGFRSQPYSTSFAVNNQTFSRLAGNNTEVHWIGELWAEVLHLQLAALVDKYGFSEDAKTNPNGSGGNVLWLHLLIDALSIQPCSPTFLDARLAWIQADANRYAGANKCLLWNVFASRGIGINANSSHTDNFDIPAECS
ncbi:hypothetical protein EXIGLDRAFT_612382 [Exidia glandulosa HHB12029]|uniref:Extracellular metalloproteinase n=1 Tax=Exidia glandulosa HHB12029 TaxID=1314781 RepID=A0A165IU19_EXIGL|nr:hypothetical protein EXIGLDRAFT_612382 [Exidia glandulosa HHB12029]